MSHPFELTAARTLRAVEAGHASVQRDGHYGLHENFYFSWDSEDATVNLLVHQKLGILFEAEAGIHGTPRWLSLNLAFGTGALEDGDILGLVADLKGCAETVLPIFIRSMHGTEIRDTYLDEPLTGLAQTGIQTVLHRVDAGQALCQAEAFHTLVVLLPRQDFHLEIRGLRLFVIPVAQAVGVALRRAGSWDR